MAYRVSRPGRSRNEPRAFTWPAIMVGVILILVGLAIMAYWVNFALKGNLPQGLWTVENNQYIAYHIGAEGLMALLAIVGGFGLLVGRGWGMATALVALGALLYTGVNSLAWSTKNAPGWAGGLTPVFLGVLATVMLSFLALHWSRRY